MSKDNNSPALNPQFDFEKAGIGGIPPNDFVNHIAEAVQRADDTTENKGVFLVRPADTWMEQAKIRPKPRRLFGDFWFEGELCILFADTNTGKSILAVQIGNSICKGESIPGFDLESTKQPVLYCDFELTDKQFENRYSKDFQQHYTFGANFFRAELNPEKADYNEQGFESFEQYLYNSLERSINETGAKILIIDNITYLKDETEKAKSALPLMKYLQGLKKKYGLSILVLAHTPKRDLSKPISRNDLQGSKMLINFADTAFAIGESTTDKSVRYFKQIKARNTEIVFDSENVCVCQIIKPYNFLQFEFLNYGTEQAHLKQFTDNDKEQRIAAALELKKQGVTNTEIARQFNVSESAIRKWLKKANEGDIKTS